jgi:hypothetical protein
VINGQTGILVAQRDENALHDAIVKLYDEQTFARSWRSRVMIT